MTKLNSLDSIAEWLSQKIDSDDTETSAAFRNWIESSKTTSFQCYVAQEAWLELLEAVQDERLH